MESEKKLTTLILVSVLVACCCCFVGGFMWGRVYAVVERPAERIVETVSDARIERLQARIEAIEARLERRKIGEEPQ